MTQRRRRGRPGPRTAATRGVSLVGELLDLQIGPVAHGGLFVARHEGRVVFVRHTLSGERVIARVTEGGTDDRYLRADAVEVLTPSPHRVSAPCPYAVPGGCGGCDLQHVDLEHQRVLKGAVVTEAFRRVAGVDVSVRVQPLPGATDGLGWRTRVGFAVGPDGRAGLRRHRSREVVALETCAIAHPAVLRSGALQRRWRGVREVDVVTPGGQDAVVVAMRSRSAPSAPVPQVTERVRTAGWSGELTLSARGFWQVHPGAPATLVERVLTDLAPQPGERVLDLYAGVGLFTLALAAAVGVDGAVVAVEADPVAVGHGWRNAAAYPQVEYVGARVERIIQTLGRADLVVLDPPRNGAGHEVMAALARVRPRAVAYVSCDPATLARDVRYAAESGYGLAALHAYDAFPMTHHVECVALLRPVPATTGRAEPEKAARAVGGRT
ncbi:MAG: class I SAM-dependent RNA methyltransferase [Dermatophilaceae bacterium]